MIEERTLAHDTLAHDTRTSRSASAKWYQMHKAHTSKYTNKVLCHTDCHQALVSTLSRHEESESESVFKLQSVITLNLRVVLVTWKVGKVAKWRDLVAKSNKCCSLRWSSLKVGIIIFLNLLWGVQWLGFLTCMFQIETSKPLGFKWCKLIRKRLTRCYWSHSVKSHNRMPSIELPRCFFRASLWFAA